MHNYPTPHEPVGGFYMPRMAAIHPTAEVEPGATVHPTAKIWRWCHICKGAYIGEEVSLGDYCFVGEGVIVPRGCRLQNRVSLHPGVCLSEDIFFGEGAIICNDKYPRVGVPWYVQIVTIGRGASLGAGSVILPGMTIGEYAMVGAGSVVTKDVPDFGIVYGNPARLRGYCQKDGTPWEPGA